MEEGVRAAGFDEAAGLPKLLDIEQVSGGWIKKYILTYCLPDGRELKYDVVSRKELDEYRSEIETLGTVAPQVDAVCIVGHTAEDEFLLIREFRFPMNRMCVAFPAGLRERGEEIIECAARELREETGFDLARSADGSPVRARACVQPGFSSLGMGDESIAMVFAEVVHRDVSSSASRGRRIFAREPRPAFHPLPTCAGDGGRTAVRIRLESWCLDGAR